MARKKDGKEVKKVYSVRLEPDLVKKIKKEFGSISNFINLMISIFKD